MKRGVLAAALALTSAGVSQAQPAGRPQFGEVARLQQSQSLSCVSGLNPSGTVAELDIVVRREVPVGAQVSWSLGSGVGEIASGELRVATTPSILHVSSPLPADHQRRVVPCQANARWGPVTVVPRLPPGRIDPGRVVRPVGPGPR